MLDILHQYISRTIYITPPSKKKKATISMTCLHLSSSMAAHCIVLGLRDCTRLVDQVLWYICIYSIQRIFSRVLFYPARQWGRGEKNSPISSAVGFAAFRAAVISSISLQLASHFFASHFVKLASYTFNKWSLNALKQARMKSRKIWATSGQPSSSVSSWYVLLQHK